LDYFWVRLVGFFELIYSIIDNDIVFKSENLGQLFMYPRFQGI